MKYWKCILLIIKTIRVDGKTLPVFVCNPSLRHIYKGWSSGLRDPNPTPATLMPLQHSHGSNNHQYIEKKREGGEKGEMVSQRKGQ